MKFKKTLSAIVASAATVVAFSSHAGAVDQANLITIQEEAAPLEAPLAKSAPILNRAALDETLT
jgi:hypothetical protein